MHEPQQQSNPSKRSHSIRILVAAVGILAVLTILVLVWKLPPRLNSQQVVNEPGTFRFPTGNSTLQIAKDQSGNLTIAVHRRTKRFYFIPYTVSSDSPITFESDREWFVSVDKYQRLWVFRGQGDQKWGELRQMPSGEVVPHFPAVLLHGSYFTGNGVPVFGVCSPTTMSDWAGVPAEFLARVRASGADKGGNPQTIPHSAPPLTTLQESQLAGRLW